MLDLDEPLTDLRLPPPRAGGEYRALLVVARLGGNPLGAAAMPVPREGRVSRDRLAFEIRRQLEPELNEAFARRGFALPAAIPAEGIAGFRTRARRKAQLPSVSVVVATCRGQGRLERAVRSILACDYDAFEVIVVENRPDGSGTRRMLAEQFGDDPRVRYIEEPSPGLSRARNAGLAAADGDVVAFTDDDVVVDPAWVWRCAAAFNRADDVACVTGLILPLELETEAQLLLEQFGGFGRGFRPRLWRLEEARNLDPLMPYTPGAIGSGANTVLRSTIAHKIGGFDPALGAGTPAAGGEDLDLYIRLLRDGHAVAYEPGAIVWHAHRDGEAGFRHQVYGYGVGLGATLAKQLFAGPERHELLRAVPAGIRYARDPGSRKNAGKAAGYPRRLEWLERLGMTVGPAAYFASALTRPLRSRSETTASGWALHVDNVRLTSGQIIEIAEVARPGVRERRRPARAVPTAAERALAWIAVAACVAAPLFVALRAPLGLRFAAVLAFFCVAPGAALVAVFRGRTEPGLALGVSLGVTVVVAQSMLWFHAWHPDAYLYGLAALCFPLLLTRLGRARRRSSLAAREWPGAVLRGARGVPLGHACLLAVAMSAWAVSLLGANLRHISGFGLLSALPPTYFLAFALLLVGFAAAVTRREVHPKLLGLYILGLILVLHGTTALLYDEPRYTWTYKHLGVINLISATGSVNRDIDIYNNWPAFFAANAWLSKVGGIAPISYAAWAQVFFNIANVAALRFALKALTRDERLLWTATLLFVLGNWVGQDYLSPQAFGFVLSLVVVGLCLRCAPVRAPRSRLDLWLARRLRRMTDGGWRQQAPDVDAPLGPHAALTVGGLCYLAVVTSHQLSPVMLILAVAAMSLVVRRVPLWVPLAMVAIELWWLELAWPFVGLHFRLIDPGTPGAAASARDLHAALPGAVLGFKAPIALVTLMALLALLGSARRLRTGYWDLAPACLVVTPFLVPGIQSYGGEGLFRAYLFALPWLAFFAAAACAPAPAGHGEWRPFGRLMVAATAAGACLLFAYFGQELANHIKPDEVDAESWYELHAPAGSTRIHLAGSDPTRLTARYPSVALNDAVDLLERPGFRRHRLGVRDVPNLEHVLQGLKARPIFLVLSRRQEDYARLNGLLPAGSLDGLVRALRASSSFRLVYRRGDSSIFEYKPPHRRGSPG